MNIDIKLIFISFTQQFLGMAYIFHTLSVQIWPQIKLCPIWHSLLQSSPKRRDSLSEFYPRGKPMVDYTYQSEY